jgi:hypothetical protein
MPKLCKIGMTTIFLAGFAALATLFVVGHVEGAKPAPVTPISLNAEFDTVWTGAGGVPVETRIRNDYDGQIYVDRADTRKITYGSVIKLYPASGSDPRGHFIMKIDQAGILGRFVRLNFGAPLTGPNCESSQEGCAVDGFLGETGRVEARTISISTQIVLAESNGQLVRDVSAPLNMEKMKAGDRKVVGLGISFTPDDPDFDHQYDLGQFTDPENYDPGSTCQVQNYPWGAAELVCLATGQVWEFRPLSISYFNETDNLSRLLWGRVLLNYWTFCRLNKWTMPFVLTVTRQ